MHVGAAQLLGRDHLAGRRLHQRRAAEEDGALVADDDRLVRHRRHVGAARRARAHHHRDLRDAARRHDGLVVEDAAEVVLVREDLVLVGQVGAARVDEVDAGQPVLQGDLLGAQVLLHRQRVIGAALHGGVVGDDDAFLPGDAADAGDDAGRRDRLVIDAVGGELRQFEERRTGVEQSANAVARQQLAARQMLLAGTRAAAPLDLGHLGAEIGDQSPHRLGVAGEFRVPRVESGPQRGHRSSIRLRPSR